MRSNLNATLAEMVRNRTANAPVGVYPTPVHIDPDLLQRFKDETAGSVYAEFSAEEKAKRGGLQGHSIGDFYPYVLVGIENPGYTPLLPRSAFCASNVDPVRYHKGTFFYVQNPDGSVGSRLYKRAADAERVAHLLKQGHIPEAKMSRADWAWVS